MNAQLVDVQSAHWQRTARLQGIIIPAITPFNAGECLDLAGMETNFARWRDTDVAGYMVLGSNGEFRSLSDEESRQVARQAVALKGEKTLIVGIGRDSLHHTLEFLASLDLDGIDYVSALTPHYFGRSMDGNALARYYTAVADAAAVPVVIYVAPSFANGVLVPPATLRQLADHPNIAGVKDTSNASMVDYMLAVGLHDDFEVLAGSLDTIMTTLSFGGAGGVLSAANYLPRQCAHLTTLWHSGERTAAFAYYARLRNLVKATGGVGGVAGVKACMDVLGYAGGAPRQPLSRLRNSDRTRLLKTLENGLGLLDQAAG